MAQRRNASWQGSITLGGLSALGLLLSAAPAQALTLTGDAATDFTATVVGQNLGNATDAAELPDGRVVVTEKGGNVKTFTPGTPDPVIDNTIGPMLHANNNEQGLLSVVADPDFATNQFVYFYASVGADQNNRHNVLRFKLGADGKLSAMKAVIDMGLMGPANHDGSGMSIYGGNLYVGVGDTGNNSSVPPHNHFGSCLNHANGKVLRVSLAEATLGQPPSDNPLVNLAMVTGCDQTSAGDNAPFVMKAPEKRIFAWGFRNPFRIWADPMTGKVWVGDVGETTREEIDVVDVAKGRHYGYPFYEGTKDWRGLQAAWVPTGDCMGMTPASPCVAPQTDYGGDSGNAPGEAVIGGRILDGCGWPAAWKSRYIFGDHVLNKISTIDVNATRDGVVANSQKDFATSNNVTAFRMGTDNALYVVELGRVTRITAKAAPAAMPGTCLTTNPAPTMGAGGTGAGGSAGMAGTAGASMAGSAGSGMTGGGQATGGTGNPGGGTAPSAGTSNPGTSGTATSTAGSGGSGGTPGNPPTGGSPQSSAGSGGAAAASDDGGCGCHVAGGGGSAALGLGALISALGLVLGRRRSRSS